MQKTSYARSELREAHRIVEVHGMFNCFDNAGELLVQQGQGIQLLLALQPLALAADQISVEGCLVKHCRGIADRLPLDQFFRVLGILIPP